MVGIFHCVNRQRDGCSDFIFDRADDRAPVVATSSGKITEASCVGTGSRTGRLEVNFAEPTASAVSQQLDELPLWANQDSLSHMHGLDRDWPGAGAVSLRVSRDSGTIRVAAGPRGNSPASLRILGLGRRTAGLTGNFGADGPDSIARLT